MRKTASGILLIALLALAAGCSRESSITGDDSSGNYTISGKVLYESGYAIKDVYVSISGTTTKRGFDESISSYSVQSNDRGEYVFTKIGNGSYTITPSKSDFTFTPPSYSVMVNGVNVSIGSFTGIPNPSIGPVEQGEYTIIGQITDIYGAGIGGISVGLAGRNLKMTAVTNQEGYFSFTKVPNDSYTIAPGKGGYSFSPPFTTFVVRGGDVTLDTIIASRIGESEDETVSAGTHLYFPMSRNASWILKRSIADFINQDAASYTLTLTVTGTKTIGGDQYWVVIDDSDVSESYFRIMDDTVYKFTNFATAPMKNAGALADTDPYTDPLPYIRLDAEPSTTYDILRHSEWIYGVGHFFRTWTGTYHGMETVTVIAGTFADCRKYEILYDTALVSGSTQRRITTTMLWLAPNVGVVKLSETKTDGDTTTYTREEELIGYSVP